MSTDAHARALHTIAVMAATLAAPYLNKHGEAEPRSLYFSPGNDDSYTSLAADLYENALIEVNERLPILIGDTHPPVVSPAPWICQGCRQPILGDGTIRIIDRRSIEAPGYDPDAREDTTALDDRGNILAAETAERQVAAALALVDDPGIKFNVYHDRCLVSTAMQDYQIATSRAERIEQWTAWLHHLSLKNWFKKRDVVTAMVFWCDRHALTVNFDLS